jgi:drug/metabolite transporter (DMT)-like permease
MKKEYVYAGVSIFCWSTVAVVTKLLLQDLNQFQLLWVSSFFAGLFLLAVNLITGNLKQLKQWKPKDYAISALCGIPGTFLYYVFYYAGAARMEASHAFIVNYLWPIMSVVFACVILKEKLTFKKLLAIGVSFVGVGIVSFSKLSSFSTDLLVGTVLCMLIIAVMNNLLNLMGVPPVLREAFKGFIVIVAVLLQKKESNS